MGLSLDILNNYFCICTFVMYSLAQVWYIWSILFTRCTGWLLCWVGTIQNIPLCFPMPSDPLLGRNIYIFVWCLIYYINIHIIVYRIIVCLAQQWHTDTNINSRNLTQNNTQYIHEYTDSWICFAHLPKKGVRPVLLLYIQIMGR